VRLLFPRSELSLQQGPITGIKTAVVLPATTFIGFFFAGGVEYMLQNGFFIKREYRFADYGAKRVQQVCTDVRFRPGFLY
jgi:opacity protein-like surface antigen